MWTLQRTSISNTCSKTTFFNTGVILQFSEILCLLAESHPFRAFFTDALLDTSFQAFFWEVPAITSSTVELPFECVQTDAPSLHQTSADLAPFAEQFTRACDSSILTFPNLAGDALLIVPRAVGQVDCYCHLASFLRDGPADQIHEFWIVAANSLKARLSSVPLWLSTAGLGVSWLHLRIDSRPKYYRFAPYKNACRSA